MNDRYSSCMFSLLAGGLVGAGVALLLAPQSGRVTREAMRGKLHEAAGSARGLKDRVVHRAEEIRDETRHRVDGAISALKADGANGADKSASA